MRANPNRDNPNRCPHCWSSLPPAVDDSCPHCHRGLGRKAPKRRGRDRIREQAPPASPPPVFTAYQPYTPPAPPPAAPAPIPDGPYPPPPPAAENDGEPGTTVPYEPYVPPGPPPPPSEAPAYALYQGSGPPAEALARSPQPEPDFGPGPGAAAGPGAVAVLERDPVEFPGQPLPAGFFDALPERARRAPGKLSRKVVVIAVVAGGALVSMVGQWSDRNEDITSPARHLVAGACAEYRDFTTLLEGNGDDFSAVQEGFVWFQNNRDRFVEAARLDPGLQDAADFVVFFAGAIDGDFQALLGLSQSELDQMEEPLSQACFTGPGRA